MLFHFPYIQGNMQENGQLAPIVIPTYPIIKFLAVSIATNITNPRWIVNIGKRPDILIIVRHA
jgi:hypothetical protein